LPASLRRGGCRLGRRRGGGPGGLTRRTDDANHGTNRHLGPRCHADLGQHAGAEGLDLDGRLVGLDLGYRLALFDGVAQRFQPIRDRALGHVKAHLGHRDFSRHASSG